MSAVNEERRTLNSLSSLDRLRVCRFLTRGKAPDDPRMAAAAIELAESFQGQSRIFASIIRWTPVFIVVSLGYAAVPAALDGDKEMAILYGAILLCGVFNLLLNPATRPRNVGRSLEASRRVVAGD